ncbi:MAG: undecaprenyl-diphosphate phosphatase [Gemmatimonadota bacterium]|jgi:undecaprenyl-diphosphatase|nr:undecaprenyl-diphosphate phosphatase [Gemmatimonadota bacterium]
MMVGDLLKATLLGLVEGLTEFIPVSSTGHLIVAEDALNWTGPRANVFLVFVQLPAILAVLWVYRLKIAEVVLTLPSQEKSRRLVWNLLIATIPAVLIGLPTDDWVEAHFYSPVVVAIALALGGAAFIWIERNLPETHVFTVDDIPIRAALIIGFFQVLAVLVPGTSRSGATIMGGLLIGFSRLAATEFSFFLAIPAMFGATALKLWSARNLLTTADIPVFLAGALASFISALIAIRALLAFVSTRTFVAFGWYRIALGLLLLALYWNPF